MQSGDINSYFALRRYLGIVLLITGCRTVGDSVDFDNDCDQIKKVQKLLMLIFRENQYSCWAGKQY